jgi:putative Mn2+ efflux pump MntP
LARVIALILPLCLDTFAVAAALGMTRPTGAQRIRFSLLFAAFEGGMPVIGLLVGAGLGRVIGDWSEYVAIAALVGLGAYMLWARDEDEERVRKLATSRGPAMIALGLSVSLDELAIGFSLGLLNVPIVPAIVLIAAQAFVVSQVGFALGTRIGEATREGAERLAGAVLIVIAGALLVGRILGHAV